MPTTLKLVCTIEKLYIHRVLSYCEDRFPHLGARLCDLQTPSIVFDHAVCGSNAMEEMTGSLLPRYAFGWLWLDFDRVFETELEAFDDLAVQTSQFLSTLAPQVHFVMTKKINIFILYFFFFLHHLIFKTSSHQ